MRRIVLAVAAVLLSLPALAAEETPTTQDPTATPEPFGRMTVEQVAGRLGTSGFYVFDNNSEKVFAQGHVPGAKWLQPLEYEAKDLPADKNATLVFYCANDH
jgi:hypothetical protein